MFNNIKTRRVVNFVCAHSTGQRAPESWEHHLQVFLEEGCL